MVTTSAVVLVGDVGGTNARLSVWKSEEGVNTEVFAKTYKTAEYKTFDAVMTALLENKEVAEAKPQAAALALAGPVEDNCCNMTNLSWIVDGRALEKKYGFKVGLLNDFEAVGYGITELEEKDLMALNDVPKKDKAPKVVMGPGTGLGAAQMMWDSGMGDYRVWPGEGAHATFAPRGWKQQALQAFANTKLPGGHCEVEQVACGSGLELIYEFLISDEVANRPLLLKDVSPKEASNISELALADADRIAIEAVDMFLAIVGAEAGAMALRCLSKGGVYIAGGITPKLMQRADAKASLLEGYLNPKLRQNFKDILAAIPLYVVLNEKVGQIGAVSYAKRLLD